MRRFGAAGSNLHLDVVFPGQVARAIEYLSIEGIQGKVIQKMHHVDPDIDCPLDNAHRVQDGFRPTILNGSRRPWERPGAHSNLA